MFPTIFELFTFCTPPSPAQHIKKKYIGLVYIICHMVTKASKNQLMSLKLTL